MGIKKKARPINKAKNAFIEYLIGKGAKKEDIDVFIGDESDWTYYRHVSVMIGTTLYSVFFEMWGDKEVINYKGGEYAYQKLSIEEFMELIEN